MRVKMRGETSEVTGAQNAYGYKYEDEYSVMYLVLYSFTGYLLEYRTYTMAF